MSTRPRLTLIALALLLALVGTIWALSAGPGAFLAEGRDRAVALAAETAAPALARWLAASARNTRAEGVAPVPAEIRTALAGFVDAGVLDQVRYRIGGGKAISLHTLAFLHPHTRAVTLDGLIVFRDGENAAKPRYWVHEIAHLEQIGRWGLDGFARRYLLDAAAVEAEAWALTQGYVAWALRRELEAADAVTAGRSGG